MEKKLRMRIGEAKAMKRENPEAIEIIDIDEDSGIAVVLYDERFDANAQVEYTISTSSEIKVSIAGVPDERNGGVTYFKEYSMTIMGQKFKVVSKDRTNYALSLLLKQASEYFLNDLTPNEFDKDRSRF